MLHANFLHSDGRNAIRESVRIRSGSVFSNVHLALSALLLTLRLWNVQRRRPGRCSCVRSAVPRSTCTARPSRGTSAPPELTESRCWHRARPSARRPHTRAPPAAASASQSAARTRRRPVRASLARPAAALPAALANAARLARTAVHSRFCTRTPARRTLRRCRRFRPTGARPHATRGPIHAAVPTARSARARLLAACRRHCLLTSTRRARCEHRTHC